MLMLDDLAELVEKPTVDVRGRVDVLEREALWIVLEGCIVKSYRVAPVDRRPARLVGRAASVARRSANGRGGPAHGRVQGSIEVDDPLERSLELERPLGGRLAKCGEQAITVVARESVVFQPVCRHPTRAIDLQASQSLLPSGPKRPSDRHRLADRLHLHAQGPIGVGELLKSETGELDDNVVEDGFERRGSPSS